MKDDFELAASNGHNMVLVSDKTHESVYHCSVETCAATIVYSITKNQKAYGIDRPCPVLDSEFRKLITSTP